MKAVIKNISTIVSGDIDKPLLEGDTIVIQNGKITQLGWLASCDLDGTECTIDANGTTVIPGLIDSHVHPVIGDYTPRQRTVDFIDSSLHGGVTTMISAGEVHFPGRPKDVVGLKACAIAVSRSYENLRPSGVKVHGGAPILELGLKEDDFAEMATNGVHLIGEIGLGSVKTAEDASRMVQWGRKYEMKSTIHTGGPSAPGSSHMTAETTMAIQPDIVGHINGGTTSLSIQGIERLVTRSEMALEIVHCGNPRTAIHTVSVARSTNQLHRVIIGTDMPTGTGVIPLGMLRVISFLASVGEIPPALAIAMATGNTSRLHGLSVGLIREGFDADLVILDAPQGSVADNALEALKAGDLPGISMVLIDGEVQVKRSRNTPPATAMAQIVGQEDPGSGHP